MTSTSHSVDVISDILSTLRLTGQVDAEARLPGQAHITLPSVAHSVSFHLVREGSCTLEVAGDGETQLQCGDFVLVPHGRRQVITGTGKRVSDAARLLHGTCRFDEGLDHPLIVHLPGKMLLRPTVPGFPAKLQASLDLLAAEATSGEQGREAVVTRLIEIIFIQTVRLVSTQGGELARGYVGAMADASLFRALLAIHKRWMEPWTLAGLAQEAGMSRAVFSRRFTEKVGIPPIGYLTDWRLMKARRLLRDTPLDMDEVAKRCGYASAPSLSRRFTSAFGIGPGAYRKNGAIPASPGAFEGSV